LLVSPSSIVLSADETLEVERVEGGAIEMSSAPTGDSLAPTATALVSLWGTNTAVIGATLSSKLSALSHAMCVLSMTGPLELHHRMQCESYRWSDFEGAAEVLPAILRAGSAAAPIPYSDNRAIVFGWSAQRGCMALAAFRSEDGYAPDVSWCIGEGRVLTWASPGYRDADPFAPLPDTVEQMAAFTRRQLAHYREQDPTVMAGRHAASRRTSARHDHAAASWRSWDAAASSVG
jgi:hypothetical protein